MGRFKRIIKALSGVTSGAYTIPWVTPGIWWSKGRQLEEYRRYVHTVVSAIAMGVGKMEPQVFKFNPNNPKKTTELPNHDFLKLLRRPNPNMSQFQLLELTQTYIELCGEAFWYLAPEELTRKPTSLTLIRPDLITKVVVPEKDNPLGAVTGYVMRSDSGEEIPFDRDEIIHFKTPNPLNPYRGIGIVEAAMVYIQTEEASSLWIRNSIMNAGRPSGLLKIDGVIDEDEYEQIKRNLSSEITGSDNAGKTIVIKNSQKVEFQKIGMELENANLEQIRNLSRDDIMAMWRVSKTILGITDDVNRASAKEARAVWIENILMDRMWRLVDTIESQLFDRYGEGLTLDFADPSPIFHEDTRENFKAGLLTLNEARAAIGEKEVAGGDVRYMPLNIVPVNDSPSNTNDNTEDDSSNPPEDGE